MRKTFYILLLAVFVSQLTIGVVNVILPLYFRSLQLDMTSLNLIFAAFEFALLFSMAFIGKISDIICRKHLIAFALLLHSIVSYLNVFVSKIYEFAILRALRSVASVSDNIVAPAYTSDIFKDGRGAKLGFLHAFRHSGLALGGIIGGIIFGLLGFQQAFYLTSAITFVVFLMSATMLKEPPREIEPNIKKELSPELLKLSIISAIIWIGIRSVMPTIFPVYISEVFSQPPQVVGTIIGVGLLGFSLFNLVGGRLSDSIGVKNTTLISMGGNALTSLFLFFAPNIVAASVLFFGIMSFHGIGQTGFSTWTILLSRSHKRAQDYGTYRMIAGIGTIPGLVLSGLVADVFGIEKVFLFAAIIFIISLVLMKTSLNDIKSH